MTADRSRSGTVLQGGRRKAYRPMPRAERATCLERGLEAYARGDFFEAHELLEPAWMGTAEPAERELHQGLIKLAAAYVHGVRGNPLGMTKNLAGARAHLREVGATDGLEVGAGIELPMLLDQIEVRLEQLALGGSEGHLALDPPLIRRNR